MKRVIDISMPIYEGMTVYKNRAEKQPKIEVTQDFDKFSAHECRLHLDAHTGTHVDAPLHMIPGGATMESIAIERLVGECRVVDLTGLTGGIGRDDLTPLGIRVGEKILFKTRNSSVSEFDPEFIYLKEDGAKYLCEIGVDVVGTDALGIERSQPDHETHVLLFQHNVVVIEGLRLQEVNAGRYLMVAAPLKLVGTDAAPARVLLIEE